jgi:hypothetical protein
MIRLRLRFVASVLPILGALGCGSSSTGPSGLPLSISFSPTSVAQGNAVAFTIILPTAAQQGGMLLLFTFSGIATGVDSTYLPVDTTGAPLQGTLTIPSGAPDGTLTLTISVPQINQHASAALTIQDTQQPTVSLNSFHDPLGGFSWYGELIAGSADTISIAAADNHQLAWVGWSLSSTGTLADSVAASGTTGTATFVVHVPATLIGSNATFTAFATDADGNRATSATPGMTVASLTTHPEQSIPRGASVNDVAFDSARGLVYLAKPDSLTVAVLALGSMTYQSSIAFPAAPTSVDLTPSGDSLIVGLGSPPAIAIVDLTSPVHPILSTIPLTSSSAADTVYALRVAADSRAIIYTSNNTQQQGIAVELNLTTGVQTALYTVGEFGCQARPMRSGDRTHVMLLNCPDASTIYLSATHTYSPAGYFGVGGGGGTYFTSASASAPYLYQFAHQVIDSTLTGPQFNDPTTNYGAVIAPNGNDYYVGAGECIYGSGCADTVPGLLLHYVQPLSQPQEIIIAPHPVYELAVAPGGGTLLALTADTIVAMDLTHSTPATAAQIAQFKRLRRRPRGQSVRPLAHVPPINTSPTLELQLAGRVLRPVAPTSAAH